MREARLRIQDLARVGEADLAALDVDRRGLRRLVADDHQVVDAVPCTTARAARPRASTQELDRGVVARLDEDRLLRRRRPPASNGDCLDLQRRQQRLQPVELGLGEARADAAGVAQLAVRARACPPAARRSAPGAALPRQPAADQQLLALDVLDLHPAVAAPPGLVGAVQPLGDHALQALLGADGEHLRAVADDVRRRAASARRRARAPPAARAAPRTCSAISEWPSSHSRSKIMYVTGSALRQPPHRRLGGDVHAPLQRLEARPAVGAERHDLAVEDRRVRAQRAVEPRELRIARGDVGARARLEAQAPGLGERDRAHAVPLDLVAPALVVARQLARRARASAGPARASARGPGPPPDPSGGSSSPSARRALSIANSA